MNKTQRKTLEKAISLMEQAGELIEEIGDEEGEKFANLTEGLQATDANQKLDAYADQLHEMSSQLADYVTELNEIIEG